MLLSILGLYYLLVLLIGYIASKRTQNSSDYILGGRQFNSTITALGAGASDMSGWLLLGLPGAIYVSGLTQIWMPIGLIIGAWLNWTLVAKRLRICSEVANNSLTLPSYLDNRLSDQSGLIRLTMAVTFLVFFTVYIASGIVGFADLFKLLFGLDYNYGLWLGALSIVLYTSWGGFIAVNWVDLFQGCLMLLALLLLPALIGFHFNGGSDELIARFQFIHFNYYNPFKQMDWIAILSLIGWGLGYFGQPHILVRFMAAKSGETMVKARRICMGWMVLCLIGAMATGLLGAALYADHPLQRPETIFLEASGSLLPQAIAGILFAAVLSAIMSTISAQLLVCASALVEDIGGKIPFLKLTSRKELILNKISVVIIALIALDIARNPNNNILELVSYAWAGLGSAFGPLILLSLYWSKLTRNGALVGMISGGLMVAVWSKLSVFGGIFELYELVPGFIAGGVGCFIGTLLDYWIKKDTENFRLPNID